MLCIQGGLVLGSRIWRLIDVWCIVAVRHELLFICYGFASFYFVENFGCWMVAALEKCRACSLQGKVVGSGFARAGPRCSRNLQLSLVAIFSAGVASRAALLYCTLLLLLLLLFF